MTQSVPVQASCKTHELLGLIPWSLHRPLVCTDGNLVYQAVGTNMIWASRAALICRSSRSSCCALRAFSVGWLSVSLQWALRGALIILTTFFHWDVTSDRLFCGWKVKNCGFLPLLAISQLQGNLLWVLVHSAEKSVLVMAEVPSGSDTGLQGTSEVVGFCFCFFVALYSFYSKTLVLKSMYFSLGKCINHLQLILFSSKLVFFVTSSCLWLPPCINMMGMGLCSLCILVALWYIRHN